MLGVATLAVLLFLRDSAVGQGSSSLPVRYNISTLEGDGEICPPADQRDAVRANISQDIRMLLNPTASACSCGGVGWTRIAYLDMTDPNQQCPPAWNLVTTPKRSCTKNTTNGCDSANFSAGGLQYSQVCGQIVGYQQGTTDAFFGWFSNGDIDGGYVDGVSVTHGTPREHIWTFASAHDESLTTGVICPCTNINNPTTDFNIPDFVGNDYFCETGVPTGSTWSNIFFSDDPLWDGDGCGPTSTCCTFNNPPWFCKQLPRPTIDDLEVRICGDEVHHNERTPIELIEIYVK